MARPLPAAPPAHPLAPPAMAAPAEQPLSHTETFYATRLDTVLRQFGYDTFQTAPAPPRHPPPWACCRTTISWGATTRSPSPSAAARGRA
ncbi:hypothetical protein ACFQU7_17205 [Pseudoroseomonas wenyumeiae]